MTVNQIYQLLNDTAAEVYGSQAVTVLDLQGMLSLRDTVFGTGTDNYLNTLVDRIGKTVLRTLDFVSTFPKLLMNEYEFGAVLQKVSIAPFAATTQEAWNVGTGGFTPDLYRIDKPSIYQDFFKDANTWTVCVSVPDVMFKTAFTSAEAMGAFITAIFDSISTSINMQLENTSRLAIAGLVGEKINANNGVIDLVAKPSVLYNIPGRVRATSRDNMHVMILTEFASACATYLESDTFNDELVKLPYYTEVEYWQGTGASAPNFADCSTINIKIPSDGTVVNQSGVVGVFADREALAVGLYDRFSAADRNNRDRYTNYTEGCTIQSIVDTSESAVIFIVKDATP